MSGWTYLIFYNEYMNFSSSEICHLAYATRAPTSASSTQLSFRLAIAHIYALEALNASHV